MDGPHGVQNHLPQLGLNLGESKRRLWRRVDLNERSAHCQPTSRLIPKCQLCNRLLHNCWPPSPQPGSFQESCIPLNTNTDLTFPALLLGQGRHVQQSATVNRILDLSEKSSIATPKDTRNSFPMICAMYRVQVKALRQETNGLNAQSDSWDGPAN